jgi:hypothetical protein
VDGKLMADGFISIGVVIERRDSDNRWIDHTWTPVAVLPGANQVDQWLMIDEGDGWARYHARTLALELFKGETEGYRYNLSQTTPLVYVIMQAGEDEDGADYEPCHVTLCPYEAMGYAESGDEFVEGVPLPDALIAWAQGFVDMYHVDEPFKKRKNKKFDQDAIRRAPRA